MSTLPRGFVIIGGASIATSSVVRASNSSGRVEVSRHNSLGGRGGSTTNYFGIRLEVGFARRKGAKVGLAKLDSLLIEPKC